MKIIPLPRSKIINSSFVDGLTEGKSYAVISICNSYEEEPPTFTCPYLRLTFDDFEPDTHKGVTYKDLIPFNKEMALEALRFTLEKNPEILLIHCSAGVSRSPALAEALCWHIHKSEYVKYSPGALHSPNLFVRKIADEAIQDLTFSKKNKKKTNEA